MHLWKTDTNVCIVLECAGMCYRVWGYQTRESHSSTSSVCVHSCVYILKIHTSVCIEQERICIHARVYTCALAHRAIQERIHRRMYRAYVYTLACISWRYIRVYASNVCIHAYLYIMKKHKNVCCNRTFYISWRHIRMHVSRYIRMCVWRHARVTESSYM